MEGIDKNYIGNCLHDPKTAPLCPIFRLGDIVKLSGFNFETIAKVVSLLRGIFLNIECLGKIPRWIFYLITAVHVLSLRV